MSNGADGLADLYSAPIVAAAPRVLGLMDRERYSRTRGCMDRTHWAWKFTDFAGARFQEGLCALSWLWATDLPGSDYHHSERLLEWIGFGFDFWSGLQRPAGDFDEAYPLEHSLAATAFTGFYLSEAHGFLDGALPRDTDTRFREALGRAAGWLCENDETHGFLSNHLSAAAAALWHAARITGDERFAQRARYFIDRVLSHQSGEGWYDEYGGADPGYQTHGSFYLARILELGGPPELEDSLDRSFAFLANFIHADGSLGGEYTSRNTQTYYPAAFEMMRDRSPSASWIAQHMRGSVRAGRAAGLAHVDAYNLFPLLNNYTLAAVAARRSSPALEPAAPGGEDVCFPEAGLAVVRRPRFELYVSLHKNGVFKLFDREQQRLVWTDCGYAGRLEGGRFVSSQWIDPARPSRVEADEIRTSGAFCAPSQQVMDPLRFLAFRVFSLTLGRVPRIAYWLKALLVRVLIYRKSELDLQLERRIRILDDGIEVSDTLRAGSALRVTELRDDVPHTTIHMGSSRYFVPHELETHPKLDGSDAIDPTRLGAGLTRTRRVRLD